MRDIPTLYNLLGWYDDINYEDYLNAKQVYKNARTFDNFIEAQSIAVHMYAHAKYAFSCNEITLDELHSIRTDLLDGLWHHED